MLGRPTIWCPEFMKIWAGAWLNCVVCIERTTAMSSATSPRWGSSDDSSSPERPKRLNSSLLTAVSIAYTQPLLTLGGTALVLFSIGVALGGAPVFGGIFGGIWSY